MSKFTLPLLLFLCVFPLWSQQDAQYTQYMYNTISVNPAYAGSRGMLSIAALHRSQWAGLDGAPVTQTFNIHAPMGRLRNMGYGISIVNDKIGPVAETIFGVDFSYSIQTSRDSKLSFGLKAGGNLLDIRLSELTQHDGDLSLVDIRNRFSPNIGVGFYYHSQNFYLGLSAPSLLETEHFDNGSYVDGTGQQRSYLAKERINYYLITGYVFEINPDLLFKPALLTKVVAGAPLQVDLSASFLLREKVTAGVAYRWNAAFSGFAGFQISEGLMVGLAHDRETSALGNTQFNSGSYEIFVRLDFIRALDNILTPRFF